LCYGGRLANIGQAALNSFVVLTKPFSNRKHCIKLWIFHCTTLAFKIISCGGCELQLHFTGPAFFQTLKTKGLSQKGQPLVLIFLESAYLFVPGETRSLRANKITITKANAMTTSPGKPYSSAIPVPARAVVVGAAVNFAARAAWV
jgi:hypothetical protein